MTVKVTSPKKSLKHKTSQPGGITQDEAIQKAEFAITVQENFGRDWLLAEVTALRDCAVGTLTSNSANEILRAARSLGDIAGTLNFPLVTAAGRSLEGYVMLCESSSCLPHQPIVQLHLEAIETLLKQNVTGPGGPAEMELLGGLERVVAKASPHISPQ